MRHHIEPETFQGVVALVGVAGAWTGTGHISCSALFAQKLAGALLMSEYDSGQRGSVGRRRRSREHDYRQRKDDF